MNLKQLDIRSTLEAYQSKEFKPSEVIGSCLQAIESQNPKLNAFLEVLSEKSRERAHQLDGEMGQMDRYPLFGIPVALKDNFLLQGTRATAGSKILENYLAPYTATCVERLQAAGAIVVGKTNLDEFAMGSSTENSAFGPVRNPWNLNRVAGGSSGGSAAALASGMSLASLGTDTGGSIRQPASLCGVVGLKPTYGRVSRYGIIAFASSLDQVGPFAVSAWDAARLLEVIGGYGGRDSTSSRSVVPLYTEKLIQPQVKATRIGVFRSWLEQEGIDPQVRENFFQVLDQLKSAGAQIVDIELPHAKYSLSSYYVIATSEASSNLARYDGVHFGFRAQTESEITSASRAEGFGEEVKLRIMLGTYALSAGYFDAYYGKANLVRARLAQDFEKAFEKCDCIASPTSPTTAFGIGERQADPIAMYLSDVFTLPANLAGLPAISIPSGLDKNKLPMGFQLMAPRFCEERLFQIGTAFEQIRGIFPVCESFPKGANH